MNDKFYEYLDKLRLSGKSLDSYTKKEMLAQEFQIGVTRAEEILNEYNEAVSNRKQFLQES